MSAFYDSQNKAHTLGERLGRGGEGTVYACEDFSLVAKIYHEPVDDDKAEKLRWMARNKDEQLLKIAAWVVDVLTDAPGGRVVGFLMPNVKAKEIHELYSLKSRRVHFPEATWHFLVHSAANLARAFYTLHKNAHIMGDINHGNCVVLADGTVKLIDCDSYSIKTDKMRYRCEVGVATHLAPELQGIDLGEIERENKHDNFGLAVIIFQLLFLGRHPFAGNYLGAEDKSLEDCIRENRFAYGDNAEFTKVKQPPGTLSLSEVSPRVAALFERAFWTEARPEPREWVEALEDLSGNLEQCSLHPGHHYFNGLTVCPWCRLESKTGLMLFPFVTSGIGADGEKPFNIFTIENLIANLGLAQNLPAKPPQINIIPPPSPEIIAERKISQNRRILVVTGQFVVLIMLMVLLGVGVAFFLGVIMLAFFIYLLVDLEKILKNDVAEHLSETKRAWDELENEWNQTLAPQNLNNDLAQIRAKIGGYQKFQQSSVQKLKLLGSENRHRELETHLRSFQIADIRNLGVNERQREALIVRGVKTAADIERTRLRYYPFIDETLVTNLLEWRRELERKFEFEEAELSEADKTSLVHETTEARRKIEREIESLFGSLRAASVNLRQKQKQLFAKSDTLARQLQQARSNAAAVGSNAGAIIVLSLMTFFLPMFGAIVSQSHQPAIYNNRASNSSPRYGSGGAVNSGNTSSPKSVLNVYDIPDESITDREIAELYSTRKASIVNYLYEEASELIKEKEDYKKAEQKLRFALRFNTDKVRVLSQIGYVLYEQKQYAESLKYLNDALKIDAGNEGAKTLVGSNYLRMKKFAEAKEVFIELTNNFPKSGNGFFNLGLAEKELKDYKTAVMDFRQAIKLESNNVSARYNLGICLKNLGDEKGALDEYQALLGMDTIKAEKLRKDANLNVPPPITTKVGMGRGEGVGTGSGDSR